MKKIFDSPIDMDEFNKAIEWHEKTSGELSSKTRDLEADYIASLSNESEETLVKRFIRALKEEVETFSADYDKQIKEAKKKNREEIKNSLREFQKDAKDKLDACIKWLNGDKNVDISFIRDIKFKREYVGKSKEEIKSILSDRDTKTEIKIFGRVGGKDFAAAVNNYVPVRERAQAIRDMDDLEKAKARSVREKIREFGRWALKYFGYASITLTIANAISIFALGTPAGRALELSGFYLAAGLTIKPLLDKLDSKSIAKRYNQAKEDLDEVGIYDEVADVAKMRM